MTEFLRALRPLIALVDLPRWVVPSVIALGLLSALAEGISISLIIPLIQNVASSGVADSAGWSFAPLQTISEAYQTPVICASIFGLILLKNILTFTNSCLFHWANASVSHQLRSGILRQLLCVGQS